MSSNSDTNAPRMLPHEMKPELEKAVRETLVAEPDIRGSIERSDPKNPRSNLMVCIIIIHCVLNGHWIVQAAKEVCVP